VVVDTTGNAAVFAEALRFARTAGESCCWGHRAPALQHLSPDVFTKGCHRAAHDVQSPPSGRRTDRPVCSHVGFDDASAGTG
jgi:hypothetical protein